MGCWPGVALDWPKLIVERVGGRSRDVLGVDAETCNGPIAYTAAVGVPWLASGHTEKVSGHRWQTLRPPGATPRGLALHEIDGLAILPRYRKLYDRDLGGPRTLRIPPAAAIMDQVGGVARRGLEHALGRPRGGRRRGHLGA